MSKSLQRYGMMLLPPAFVKAYERVKPRDRRLFAGDEALFLSEVAGCSVFGEYGCGQSTIWVAQNTEAQIYSVDSSRQWVQTIKRQVGKHPRIKMIHTDLGSLEYWGRPKTFQKRDNFQDYTDALWRQERTPDLVLIDGRFRICCFLTSLKHAPEGTVILFDDYIERERYHIVEEFVDRAAVCGRQCKFVVPPKDSIDVEKLEDLIERFRFVF